MERWREKGKIWRERLDEREKGEMERVVGWKDGERGRKRGDGEIQRLRNK